MLSPDVWSEVSDLLVSDSFYRRDHQMIWGAIKELVEKGWPIDAVTVGEWFESNNLIEQVAGGAYLLELATTTPSAANVRAYAEIVRDKARLRQLIHIGTQMVSDAFNQDGRDAIEIIGEAQTAVGSLLQTEPCELEGMGTVLTEMYRDLERRYHLQGALDGLSTGLAEVDRVLNGLGGGRMYVIAARPKMGKSTLAQNIAEHVALQERKQVAFFTFEMPRKELAGRMTCSLALVDNERYRTGQLEDEDWTRVTEAIRKLRDAPIRMSQPRNVRVESLVAQARRIHAKQPLGLVVVDYLQLLDTAGAENKNQGITEVSRKLKLFAVELDIPIIVLSQLSRKVEERSDKRPIPSDLRDSGAIEQDADAVIFIYRDDVYDQNSPDKGTAEVNVALQRNGPSETVRVATRLNVCRFDDLRSDWCPAFVPSNTPPRRGFGRRGG